MAEEEESKGGGKKAAGGDEGPTPRKKKAEEHVNHERWLVSYADFITLLFAFFTVLYAISQADKAKMKAVESGMKKAFKGPQLFDSGSEELGTLGSSDLLKPFPIDFETQEGLLDKNEINRNSLEDLHMMKKVLNEHQLREQVDIFEYQGGVQIKIKERVYFQKDSLKLEKISMEIYNKLLNILKEEKWVLVIEGHASIDEGTGENDPRLLSSLRSENMAKSLFKRGVKEKQIVAIGYGASRAEYDTPEDQPKNRRVEFILRKMDPRDLGQKVY